MTSAYAFVSIMAPRVFTLTKNLHACGCIMSVLLYFMPAIANQKT